MLSSVKAIHSHNRRPFYFLKRSFVDVIFLTRLFDDFHYPTVRTIPGLFAGIVGVAVQTSKFLREFDESRQREGAQQELDHAISVFRRSFPAVQLQGEIALRDRQLDEYIRGLRLRHCGVGAGRSRQEREEAGRFLEIFLARLAHLSNFVGRVYGKQDPVLRQELRDGITKTFAMSAGAALGFMYVQYSKDETPTGEMVQGIKAELSKGI
jgi:hypothetical protein